MYTGCAFVRDWEHGVLDVNQTAFVESLVSQYKVSTTSDIPGSPGIDRVPKNEDEPGGSEEFPQYRALVGSLMWPSVMTDSEETHDWGFTRRDYNRVSLGQSSGFTQDSSSNILYGFLGGNSGSSMTNMAPSSDTRGRRSS